MTTLTVDRGTAVKAATVAKIAQAIGEGTPVPISLTLYMGTVHVLCHGQDEWESWVGVFGLSPLDAVYDDRFSGSKVRVESDEVELGFLVRDEVELP